jgi:hypothetical protein
MEDATSLRMSETVIKIRVPEAFKRAVQRAAAAQFTDCSEYGRTAFLDRLRRHGFDPMEPR